MKNMNFNRYGVVYIKFERIATTTQQDPQDELIWEVPSAIALIFDLWNVIW